MNFHAHFDLASVGSTSTLTLAFPPGPNANSSQACWETSIMIFPCADILSLITTTTDLPFSRLVTLTWVPIGMAPCAAVSASGS